MSDVTKGANKMRNNGRMLITERIDQITIVGKVENFGGAGQRTIEVDPEHYQFDPGDIIEIRCYPTTTSTTAPRHSCLVRKYNDLGNFTELDAAGNQIGNKGVQVKASTRWWYNLMTGSGIGLWNISDGWPHKRSMRPTPFGRGGKYMTNLPSTEVGKDKVHPGSSVLGLAGKLMCSSSTDLSLNARAAHIGKSNNDVIDWANPNGFTVINRVDKNPALTVLGASKHREPWAMSLGELIDENMLDMHAQTDISAFHKGYLVGGGLDHPQYEGSYFKNLIGATWGRNGPACATLRTGGTDTNQSVFVRIPYTNTKADVSSRGDVRSALTTSDYIWLVYQEPSGLDPTELIGDPTLGQGKNTGSYPLYCYIQVPQICRVHNAVQTSYEHITSHFERA